MKNIEDITAPVLLITFNRAENTRKVLDKIRQAKIKKLYISNDAPREGNENDILAREEIKAMIKEIDWYCELHTLFQENNQGCGWGESKAMTWAFENEEKLIILEDDTVPVLSFFTFCDEMLERYSDDTRVWSVSGRSHQSKRYEKFKEQDYIFSHYAHTWGWATWKRCWSKYDIMMSDYPDFIKSGGAVNVLSARKEGELMNERLSWFFKNIEKNQYYTWDYQWIYTVVKNGSLGIVPAKNLIENIGFIGVHTNGEFVFKDMDCDEDFIVKRHPKFVLIDREYESLHFKNHLLKKWSKTPLYQRAFQKVLRMMKRG